MNKDTFATAHAATVAALNAAAHGLELMDDAHKHDALTEDEARAVIRARDALREIAAIAQNETDALTLQRIRRLAQSGLGELGEP